MSVVVWAVWKQEPERHPDADIAFVDPRGALQVRKGNNQYVASYPSGDWLKYQVNDEPVVEPVGP